ncbi:J domain-containing protein [Adhaeribacter soli]|uniref:J domain-containing protein n=1 Tax=Adhaeribacter soli TaxID=2607655 RepID=A0A5N1J5H7_9BACT|nr:hypothetical protein [Adhaeribacter soli]KAA9345954.1 hypothetical protein F0P94_02410 [Adhaeribacter soli]
MSRELYKPTPQADKRIAALENEIAILEKELLSAETELNTFTTQIRQQLQGQIIRIRELTDLYKKQKAAKKAKRLEQKKKGQNYREPKELRRSDNGIQSAEKAAKPDEQELKRLYKEAIRQVHPDKFTNEEPEISDRANALTVQLNAIYDAGDLEELQGFYEHIISGNAMSHVPYKPETVANPEALLDYLQKKQQELLAALNEIKTSQLFEVLKTYDNPLTFIPELRQQFDERIAVLEKRTRKGKNKA